MEVFFSRKNTLASVLQSTKQWHIYRRTAVGPTVEHCAEQEKISKRLHRSKYDTLAQQEYSSTGLEKTFTRVYPVKYCVIQDTQKLVNSEYFAPQGCCRKKAVMIDSDDREMTL